MAISLKKYYTAHPDSLRIFDEITNGKHRVTLRLLDFYICTHCKLNNTTYADGFNVYLSYKNQLRSFSKKLFDCFCRRKKIPFQTTPEDRGRQTTLSQLNFIRWVLENGILNELERQFAQVEGLLNSASSSKKRKREGEGTPGEKKRKLVKAAIKKYTTTRVTVTLKW